MQRFISQVFCVASVGWAESLRRCVRPSTFAGFSFLSVSRFASYESRLSWASDVVTCLAYHCCMGYYHGAFDNIIPIILAIIECSDWLLLLNDKQKKIAVTVKQSDSTKQYFNHHSGPDVLSKNVLRYDQAFSRPTLKTHINVKHSFHYDSFMFETD